MSGSLKDIIAEVRGYSAHEMKATADFSWRFDSSPESPKGLGQVVLIPPGYVVARVSSSFVGVAKCFGAGADGPQCAAVLDNLNKLFASFPQLQSGAYDAFFNHVTGRR